MRDFDRGRIHDGIPYTSFTQQLAGLCSLLPSFHYLSREVLLERHVLALHFYPAIASCRIQDPQKGQYSLHIVNKSKHVGTKLITPSHLEVYPTAAWVLVPFDLLGPLQPRFWHFGTCWDSLFLVCGHLLRAAFVPPFMAWPSAFGRPTTLRRSSLKKLTLLPECGIRFQFQCIFLVSLSKGVSCQMMKMTV